MIPCPGEPSGPRPGPAPVVISAQQTGVTVGNEETQSPISEPRSSRAAKFGAPPAATACSSMSVRRESTTMRHSLRGKGRSVTKNEWALRSAQRAKALVLLGRPSAAAEPQVGDAGERQEAERPPQE